MSKVEKNGHQKFTKFDNVSTEALEAFLKADVDAADAEQADIDTIIYISQLLSERRKAAGAPDADIEAAREDFLEKYYPMKEDPEALYDIGYGDMAAIPAVPSAADRAASRKARIFWLRHTARVAAIVLMLVFGGTVTANALGYDPWRAIGEWSEDVFWFTSGSGTTIELQQALDEYGISGDIIPQKLPNGYKYVGIDIFEDESCNQFIALYEKHIENYVKSILIDIKYRLDDSKVLVCEKDAQDVVIYSTDGVEYYCITNLHNREIVWQNGNIECCISGQFTQEEAEKMIDSIREE